MITLELLEFLASTAGERLLTRLEGEDLSDANTLRLLTAVRKDYPAAEAGAALELARLRKRGAHKFGDDAVRMFFTREALEQASDPLIRRYRSGSASGRHIIDVCCGIGSDLLAFARAGGDVLGIDLDPVRIAMAQMNAAALGVSARFEVGDARDPLPSADLIFFDPARRTQDGKRIFHVEQYEPPLGLIRAWNSPVMVKLSPGVDLAQIEAYAGGVEFISVDGDLKEAVLLVNGTERANPLATLLLDDGQVLHWHGGDAPAKAPITKPRGWLIEPDPALIRAGLVTDAAVQWDASQLDETIAYLVADQPPETPWARSWQVLDWMPFSVKKLRAVMREQNVGTVTVKKRGTAVTPEILIPQLKLKGSESRTLVLTRLKGEQIILICADIKIQ